MPDSQCVAGLVALNAQLSKGGNSGFLSVAQQIVNVATDFPESLALESDGRQVTFSNLLARVSQAAAMFQEAPAAASVVVCTDDSLLMIVCAMAAWSVGQAYLPVSPSGPVERLRHILNEVRPSLIATTKEYLGGLPSGDWQTLAVDELGSPQFAAAGEGVSGLFASLQPESWAYIVYTSGSTGQPKGVCVSQANLAHLTKWYSSAFLPLPQSRASQFSALTFDAAVLEIWTNLAAGAALCVPDRSIALTPEHLRDYLIDHEVTRCFATTAIAEQLLALEWPKAAKLEYLLTGADTLRVFPTSTLPFRLVNNYGPTECTVLATSGIVPPDSDRLLPTIGQPISGTYVYIADEHLKPVPDGERGEICIGGPGVAVGYLGSPELTAERFVPDPFGAQSSRIYRTGDIGKKLPSGEFEFLGRLDQQIKLRGYRIEPNEIVGALRLHPAVRAAVVKPVGSDSHRQIAAYLILKDQTTARELREHLSSRLPEYMIPDQFVRVEELPFTPNGKVDLSTLPLPASSNVLPEEELMMGPATEIQEEVGSILSGLLGGRSIALHDNFFRLGGHSLLAAQVIVRVRAAFGVDLPLRAVFESPTAAGLAEVIEDKILAQLAILPPDETASGASA